MILFTNATLLESLRPVFHADDTFSWLRRGVALLHGSYRWRRRHIPKQKHKVMNWRACDASLRRRGSLMVWFTDEAIEG